MKTTEVFNIQQTSQSLGGEGMGTDACGVNSPVSLVNTALDRTYCVCVLYLPRSDTDRTSAFIRRVFGEVKVGLIRCVTA